MTSNEIFDNVFNIHTVETDSLLTEIIIDRNFDIYDWVYKYITEDILITLLKNRSQCDKFNKFITNVMNLCKFNEKYLTMLFLENDDILEFAFIVDKNKFCKYTKMFFDDVNQVIESENIENKKTKLNINKIITGYIDFFKDVPPKEYYYITTRILRNQNNSSLNESIIQCLDSIYGKILKELPINILDYYVEGLYNAYEKDYYIICSAGLFPSVLKSYWSTDVYHTLDGKFIPLNLSTIAYKRYINEEMIKRHFPSFSKKLVAAFELNKDEISKDQELINIIMDTIKINISNINLIVWELHDNERLYLRDVYSTYYKKDICKLDFVKYYKLTHPNSKYIPYNECRAFFDKGGKINIADIFIDDIDDFLNCIMKYLSDEELIDYFKKDINIHLFNNDVSLLKYIMSNYIIKHKSTPFMPRLYSILFDNIDIIDLLIDKGYISYQELIQPYSVDIIQLFSKYPKLIKYQHDLPAVIIYGIISNNPDAILYIPWNYLPENIIINRIVSKGYFPIITEENADSLYSEPVKYISTQKMLDIIKTGNALGYVIDYSLSNYVKVIMNSILIE